MAADISQDERIGTLETPLGKDVLVLSRFDGSEALGELFEYHIEALSEQANINFNQAIGLNLSVKIKAVDQLERYFNGVLVQARWTGGRNNLYVYQLVLKPWFWLLSHTSDCRIFHKKNVPDIIVKVFQDRGFSDYRKDLKGNYPTLEYCVQYRETDMNFVCRLMEEYGIYYFFEHSQDMHMLVLADSKSCHNAIPGLKPVPYLPATDATARRDQQQFDSWSTFRGFQSGRFVLNDYDYEKPNTNLLADADQSGGYAHGSMEMFDYPGRYDDQGEGKVLAKVRLQADQAKDERRTAIGAAPSLFPGGTMTLERHHEGSENKEYLLLRCSHSYVAQDYRSGGGRNLAYNGSYEMASSDRQFRSPQVTRKSIIHGPQNAKVVGQDGEEIDVDKEGRILVQFYWDRKKDQSRRVRVAQIWAGSSGQRGVLFTPRIGDEVMIAYEEGDPDRPIVIGSAYNAVNVVNTKLPDHKTWSGILTKSSKNKDGYNMLLFDDTKDKERVKVHAEKDLVARVKNDERRAIGHNQKEDVGGDLDQSVGGNQTLNVGGPTGGGVYSLTATQKIVLTVGLSSITIDLEGITLNAPTISLKAASVEITAAAISLEGPTSIAPSLTVEGAVAWTAAAGPPPVPAPV